jgi:hypothetical protein
MVIHYRNIVMIAGSSCSPLYCDIRGCSSCKIAVVRLTNKNPKPATTLLTYLLVSSNCCIVLPETYHAVNTIIITDTFISIKV